MGVVTNKSTITKIFCIIYQTCPYIIMGLNKNKYIITAILKIETEIIANISASLTGGARIFMSQRV